MSRRTNLKPKKKQQIVSILPSLREWHLPTGYNFVGPGTEVSDRLSLNYKGSVGSKTYWLPVNKMDFLAFKHDVAYYSENNIDRIKADYNLLMGDSRHALLSKSIIATQLTARYGIETIYWTLANAGQFASAIIGFKDHLIKVLSTPYAQGKPTIMGQFFNPKTGTASQPVKDFARKWLNIKGTKRGPSEKKYITNIVFNLGLLFAPIPLMSTIYEEAMSKYYQYHDKKHGEAVNNVVEKYEIYLDSVGEFNNNGDFIITDKGDPAKYKEFFNAFDKFIDFANADRPNFQDYDKPILNEKNLKITEVNIPEKQPVQPVQSVPQEQVKSQEQAEPQKINLFDFSKKPDEPIVNLLDYSSTQKNVLIPPDSVFNLLDFAN